MGTNYYQILNHCPHCNRSERRHIGKSSGGWTFSFRGYKPFEWEADVPRIESEADWRKVLDGATIHDEYGGVLPVEAFWALVEAKRSEKNNHFLYGRGRWDQTNEWMDDKGNSFSSTEFS